MIIPLNILLWGFAVAFCLHVLEESTVGGGFVAEMKRNFWPEYDGVKFFWFNTMIMLLFVGSIVLYEVFDGAWIIFPLSWVFMFATNGLWHLLQTVILRRYAPGLITSPVYWILLYFIVRYSFLQGQLATQDLVISGIIGTALTLVMFGVTWSFRIRTLKRGSQP